MAQSRIRAATTADAQAILDIYGPIVRETSISFELDVPTTSEMASRIDAVNVRVPWLVVERRGVLAGYAYAGKFRERAAYRWTMESSVYVHPDHHRCGVARALMTALIDICRALHYRTLVAGATLPNAGSEALHESLGFKPIGSFPNVGRKFDRLHDVGFWTLDLGAAEPALEPEPPRSESWLRSILEAYETQIAP